MTAERNEKQVGKPTADKTELANMPSGSAKPEMQSQRRKARDVKPET